jgi:pSer/pThr/pTyr-binding forkhead associated (FHA) protein
MNLHLRVLHGMLKRQDGANLGSDIAVHGKRFVIGSGPDCHMRCPSTSISESHSEIVAQKEGIYIRDLRSESGTLVNGERIAEPRLLKNGDHLQIGKLEFEIVITAPVPPSTPPEVKRKVDPIGDNISDMLSAADEAERSKQKHDPAARLFKPAPAEPSSAEEKKDEKKKLVRPPQKPPGKLPPKPKIVADSTVDAAEEVLKKFFEKPKK